MTLLRKRIITFSVLSLISLIVVIFVSGWDKGPFWHIFKFPNEDYPYIELYYLLFMAIVLSPLLYLVFIYFFGAKEKR